MRLETTETWRQFENLCRKKQAVRLGMLRVMQRPGGDRNAIHQMDDCKIIVEKSCFFLFPSGFEDACIKNYTWLEYLCYCHASVSSFLSLCLFLPFSGSLQVSACKLLMKHLILHMGIPLLWCVCVHVCVWKICEDIFEMSDRSRSLASEWCLFDGAQLSKKQKTWRHAVVGK